jgi:transcriptional regulator with XRE-family HTH domain
MQNMLSPAQCRAARALLGWSQGDLETAAQVARKTIADFEGGGRRPYGRTLEALRAAFEVAGIEFIPENGGGAGVRMRKRAE